MQTHGCALAVLLLNHTMSIGDALQLGAAGHAHQDVCGGDAASSPHATRLLERVLRAGQRVSNALQERAGSLPRVPPQPAGRHAHVPYNGQKGRMPDSFIAGKS